MIMLWPIKSIHYYPTEPMVTALRMLSRINLFPCFGFKLIENIYDMIKFKPLKSIHYYSTQPTQPNVTALLLKQYNSIQEQDKTRHVHYLSPYSCPGALVVMFTLKPRELDPL